MTTRLATLALVGMTAAASAEPMSVVVVKRAGVMAYEEVAEEFAEQCRVRARVVSLGDGMAPQLSADGPRSSTVVAQASRAAERLGLALVTTRVASGPEAVRALRAMSDKVDALWLPGDTDVVTSQLFQYALRLQLERGLPVAAATRQQVHSGALVAADFSPRAAGRIAADLANRYLEGRSVVIDASELDLYSGARVTVNAQVARRLGVDVAALIRMGARIE
ncbi:MAG: hypothetical protein LC659_13790 [Myxococcales bacterium]|nr:hypothetical protein [Myxococcales bacterium]